LFRIFFFPPQLGFLKNLQKPFPQNGGGVFSFMGRGKKQGCGGVGNRGFRKFFFPQFFYFKISSRGFLEVFFFPFGGLCFFSRLFFFPKNTTNFFFPKPLKVKKANFFFWGGGGPFKKPKDRFYEGGPILVFENFLKKFYWRPRGNPFKKNPRKPPKKRTLFGFFFFLLFFSQFWLFCSKGFRAGI